jgi:hypothetical protein
MVLHISWERKCTKLSDWDVHYGRPLRQALGSGSPYGLNFAREMGVKQKIQGSLQ